MFPYTLAQKIKAFVASLAAIATAIGSVAAYAATQEILNEDARRWALLVAAGAGTVGMFCTYVLTFKVENAPTADAPPTGGVEAH